MNISEIPYCNLSNESRALYNRLEDQAHMDRMNPPARANKSQARHRSFRLVAAPDDPIVSFRLVYEEDESLYPSCAIHEKD